MEKTTIQISSNLLERLKMFKRHNREFYEEIYDVNDKLKDKNPKTLHPFIQLKKTYKIWRRINYGLIPGYFELR